MDDTKRAAVVSDRLMIADALWNSRANKDFDLTSLLPTRNTTAIRHRAAILHFEAAPGTSSSSAGWKPIRRREYQIFQIGALGRCELIKQRRGTINRKRVLIAISAPSPGSASVPEKARPAFL